MSKFLPHSEPSLPSWQSRHIIRVAKTSMSIMRLGRGQEGREASQTPAPHPHPASHCFKDARKRHMQRGSTQPVRPPRSGVTPWAGIWLRAGRLQTHQHFVQQFHLQKSILHAGKSQTHEITPRSTTAEKGRGLSEDSCGAAYRLCEQERSGRHGAGCGMSCICTGKGRK